MARSFPYPGRFHSWPRESPGASLLDDTWRLAPNRWHHVAVSVNRTSWPVNITFYVDGDRAGYGSPKMGNVNNTDLPFMIGGHKDWSGYRFSDRIDEVLVYNRALPLWEIWNIMNPGRPSYNPGFWNNNSGRKRNNNCYNYTNNKATNTFAQPGRAAGAPVRRPVTRARSRCSVTTGS